MYDHYVCALDIIYNMQVALLAEFGGPDLISSSHMDTEKPAPLSSDHVVMTFASVG